MRLAGSRVTKLRVSYCMRLLFFWLRFHDLDPHIAHLPVKFVMFGSAFSAG